MRSARWRRGSSKRQRLTSRRSNPATAWWPHHFEKHGGSVLPDEHRAKPVMQILWQQTLDVELGRYQPALGYEILAKVNPSGRSVIPLAVQPHIAISVI